jgi:hypothetical protein
MDSFNSQRDQLQSTTAQEGLNDGAPAASSAPNGKDHPSATDTGGSTASGTGPLPGDGAATSEQTDNSGGWEEPEGQPWEFSGKYEYCDAARKRWFGVIRWGVFDAQGWRFKTRYARPSGEPDKSWISSFAVRCLGPGRFMRKGPREQWDCFNAAEFNQYPDTREEKFIRTAAPFLLYCLPELQEAIKNGSPVYVVNDEITVELLRSWGFAATCCPGGMEWWRPEYNDFLKDANAVLVDCAESIAEDRTKLIVADWGLIARQVRILEWPEQAINSAEEFAQLAKTAQTYDPFSPEALGLTLSSPQDEDNGYGKFTVRTGAPTDQFWDAWNANRHAMKAAGWTPRKDDTTGQWTIKFSQEIGGKPKLDILPPDLDEALAYLDYHFGAGKRHILAIKKSATEGKRARINAWHFEAADREGQQKFILAYNPAGYDVYFSVNPIKDTLHKKATKADVAEAGWLWIDNDPRSGKPLEAERAEILARLTTDLPPGMPKFNRVIDSGRGYWGLGKLSVAQPVDGATYDDKKRFLYNNPLTEAVEAYGRGIEQAFGEYFADDCRNIDRIARLPGTVNHKTGRLARVLHEFSHDELHPIEAFPRSDEKDRKKDRSSGTGKTTEGAAVDWAKVKEPGWLKSAADLPDGTPLKIRIIVGHTGNLDGLNSNLRGKGLLEKDYRSWSEVTLALTTLLKICDYTPEQIAEALSADLPCNQHIANQADKRRAIERAIVRSYNPADGRPESRDKDATQERSTPYRTGTPRS